MTSQNLFIMTILMKKPGLVALKARPPYLFFYLGLLSLFLVQLLIKFPETCIIKNLFKWLYKHKLEPNNFSNLINNQTHTHTHRWTDRQTEIDFKICFCTSIIIIDYSLYSPPYQISLVIHVTFKSNFI